jgi:hypothetical protein
VLVDYLAYPASDTITAGSDAADACWYSVDRIDELDVTEGLLDMIRRAMKLAEEERA